MEDGRNNQIHRFAKKYLALFSSEKTTSRQLESGEFAEECKDVGFKMDCLKAFEEQYPGAGSNNEVMREACRNITDIDLLGSGLFSQWRYYTHWDQTDMTDTQVRQWFIYGLQRMLELTSFMAFQGEIEKIVIESDDSNYIPPAPGQEIRQRLTLNRNGKVCLTRYFSGDFSQVPPTAGTKKMRRCKGMPTEKIMEYIAEYFREYHGMMLASDSGMWRIELTNTDGEKWSYYGPLSAELEVNGYKLSAQTRKLLEIESLWMFD